MGTEIGNKMRSKRGKGSMQDTTLVVMAAGIGSRYGNGIKQLEPVGPGGKRLIDYSIHDALEAGFNKVVFIIRKDLEKDFREAVGDRVAKLVKVEYAFQEIDKLPEGYTVPEGRKKPWGTGQAVMMVKDLVKEPFVVINADDFYGKEGFRKVHEYMVNEMNMDADTYDMCMAGFILDNILSEYGTVTRGVCQLNEDGTLKTVRETYGIRKEGSGVVGMDKNGSPVPVSSDQVVSMNMWGLPPGFLDRLEAGFIKFLDRLESGDIKSEYLLPTIIDQMIQRGIGTVKVLETHDKWFGVTYQEDKEAVVASIRALVDAGVYKENLYD